MTSESKQITINGKVIEAYQYVHIKQQINTHHSFEIGLDLENIEKEGAHTIEKSKDWLGKIVVIKTHKKDFEGVVTNVHLAHDNGHHGQIVVSGYSSTIVLENGEHMQSWLKKPLQKIVEKITKHPKLTVAIKPEYTSEIKYETQYLETNFQFLQRLAKQYHEWLYYDGKILFFGKPEKRTPIKLVYGVDATELEIGIQTQARKYKSFSYNSFIDEQYISESPDNPAGLNELGQFAFSSSLDNYSEPTNVYSQMRVDNKADLDRHLKKKQQSDYASSNFISIKTKMKGLTLGDVIDLRSEIFKGKGDLLNKRHGEYIITEIEHYTTIGGHYRNTIIALPADIKALPEPIVSFPIAETQVATVVDNNDPDKKGRVQVKMAWQTEEMKTSWIRVLTPNAGKSDKVATNRGFVFIPEKGDQVLISFRYNDPNRPFVVGSLFNGKTGAGGSDNNKIKSITTRSGSTITFDDDNEKGSITVKDGAGNTVTLNGKDTVSVSANATISLSTGASSITLKKDGTIQIMGKDVSISGSKTTSMATDGNTFNTSASEANVNGTDVKVSALKNVEINGTAKATVSSSAITSIEGTIVKLN